MHNCLYCWFKMDNFVCNIVLGRLYITELLSNSAEWCHNIPGNFPYNTHFPNLVSSFYLKLAIGCPFLYITCYFFTNRYSLVINRLDCIGNVLGSILSMALWYLDVSHDKLLYLCVAGYWNKKFPDLSLRGN